MRTPLLVCVALALAPVLTAQTTGRVVPSSAATKEPNYWDSRVFYGTTSTTAKPESHAQYAYDSADVGGVAVWRTLYLRRPHRLGNINKATTFTSTVIMSNSPVAYNQLSTTFTANHGTSTAGTAAQTVFSGTISLPANRVGTTFPEPWFLVVTFRTVFVHAPVNGGSLVVEFINSNNSQNQAYYVEGFKPDYGTRSNNGVSAGCWYHSDGPPTLGNSGYNNSLAAILPYVGNQWWVQHGNMPSNEPNMKRSLNLIGLQGVGGTAFGRKLPIPIASLGFLDICTYRQTPTGPIVRPGVLANDLTISPLIVPIPMTYTPSTAGPSRGRITAPTIKIPNDPSLAGKSFYSQSFSLDKKLGIYDRVYMGWASKWTVGSGRGLPGSVVYRTSNNSSITGFFSKESGHTCMFK